MENLLFFISLGVDEALAVIENISFSRCKEANHVF